MPLGAKGGNDIREEVRGWSRSTPSYQDHRGSTVKTQDNNIQLVSNQILDGNPCTRLGASDFPQSGTNCDEQKIMLRPLTLRP